MANKFLPLLILLVTTVFISGCLTGKDDRTPVKNIESELIPKTNLPSGFTYMGIHEVPVDIGGAMINATEGVYRNSGEDIYIQVIKNETPEALIDQYKSRYKNFKYIPFEEVFFNGHNATKVTDYTTVNGVQKPHYTLIWAAEKSMILVGTSPEQETVMALAKATGR